MPCDDQSSKSLPWLDGSNDALGNTLLCQSLADFALQAPTRLLDAFDKLLARRLRLLSAIANAADAANVELVAPLLARNNESRESRSNGRKI